MSTSSSAPRDPSMTPEPTEAELSEALLDRMVEECMESEPKGEHGRRWSGSRDQDPVLGDAVRLRNLAKLWQNLDLRTKVHFASIQPPACCNDLLFPSFMLQFGFERFVPSNSAEAAAALPIPGLSKKFPCYANGNATTGLTTKCHIGSIAGFAYTHPDLTCTYVKAGIPTLWTRASGEGYLYACVACFKSGNSCLVGANGNKIRIQDQRPGSDAPRAWLRDGGAQEGTRQPDEKRASPAGNGDEDRASGKRTIDPADRAVASFDVGTDFAVGGGGFARSSSERDPDRQGQSADSVIGAKAAYRSAASADAFGDLATAAARIRGEYEQMKSELAQDKALLQSQHQAYEAKLAAKEMELRDKEELAERLKERNIGNMADFVEQVGALKRQLAETKEADQAKSTDILSLRAQLQEQADRIIKLVQRTPQSPSATSDLTLSLTNINIRYADLEIKYEAANARIAELESRGVGVSVASQTDAAVDEEKSWDEQQAVGNGAGQIEQVGEGGGVGSLEEDGAGQAGKGDKAARKGKGRRKGKKAGPDEDEGEPKGDEAPGRIELGKRTRAAEAGEGLGEEREEEKRSGRGGRRR